METIEKTNGGRSQTIKKSNDPSKETFEIHLSLNTVQPKKVMKTGRSMFGATSNQNFIYVAGGINKEKEEISLCEYYDVRQNIWMDLPDLNHARSSSSLVHFYEN